MRIARVIAAWSGCLLLMAASVAPAAAGSATQSIDASLPAIVVLSVDGVKPVATANSSFSLVATTPEGRFLWGSDDASHAPTSPEGLVYTLSVSL
jgi:hypothetical protein